MSIPFLKFLTGKLTVKKGTIKKCWGQEKQFGTNSQTERTEKWPFYIHIIFSNIL